MAAAKKDSIRRWDWSDIPTHVAPVIPSTIGFITGPDCQDYGRLQQQLLILRETAPFPVKDYDVLALNVVLFYSKQHGFRRGFTKDPRTGRKQRVPPPKKEFAEYIESLRWVDDLDALGFRLTEWTIDVFAFALILWECLWCLPWKKTADELMEIPPNQWYHEVTRSQLRVVVKKKGPLGLSFRPLLKSMDFIKGPHVGIARRFQKSCMRRCPKTDALRWRYDGAWMGPGMQLGSRFDCDPMKALMV